MRTVLAAILLLAALAGSAAAGGAGSVTRAQLVAGFKREVGARLTVDNRASYAGHYTALGLVQSIGNIGRYGRFTIFVTTGSEDDAQSLLADAHTGQLGTPGAAGIYWEQDTTASGDHYWLAKKRYGTNVILWWIGSSQKTDATFTRLHRALTRIVARPAA
jgi:hypothetical protein